MSAVKTAPDVMDGLAEKRHRLAERQGRRGALLGEFSTGRARREAVTGELEQRRAAAKVAGTLSDVGDLLAELEQLNLDLGVDPTRIAATQNSPGYVVRQGIRGTIPLAVAMVDREIEQAKQAIADYIDANRPALLERALGITDTRKAEALERFFAACDEMDAAEGEEADAYRLAYSGLDYAPAEPLGTWGPSAAHLPNAVPYAWLTVPSVGFSQHVAGQARANPAAVRRLLRDHYRSRPVRPVGYVPAGAVYALPGRYLDVVTGREVLMTGDLLRNDTERAKTVPDKYGVAVLHYVAPLD